MISIKEKEKPEEISPGFFIISERGGKQITVNLHFCKSAFERHKTY